MKVLVLVHADLIPPLIDTEIGEHEPWETEYLVAKALRALNYPNEVIGVSDDLKAIRDAIEEFRPKIVFNLLEEFRGEAVFDQNIVSYLELLDVPYTGCNPKGLILARDKALSKKILTYHDVKTPKFQVFPLNRPRQKLLLKDFPLIVKCLNEEASLGISQASVVHDEAKLKERVQFIHDNYRTDAIAEQFIKGREYFVGVIGNYNLKTLPVWQLRFDQVEDPSSEFYTATAKFNPKYRARKGISTGPADLPTDLEEQIKDIAKRAYRILGLSGYARMDLRVEDNGEIYLLEANPNPDIGMYDDFAVSAISSGETYTGLIDRILKLGLKWRPAPGLSED